MTSYIFAFDDSFGSQEDVEKILDAIEKIETWRSDLPTAYYLRSTLDASSLSNEVRIRCPAGARYFIAEVTENSDGFVTPETWEFLLNDSHVEPSKAQTPAPAAC